MKNKILITLIIFSTVLFTAYVAFAVLINLQFDHDRLIIFIMVTFIYATNFILMGASYLLLKRKREKIRKSFNFYIENLISRTGVGIISFNDEGEIIWISDFLAKRFEKQLTGRKLTSISPSFAKNMKKEILFLDLKMLM